MIQINEFVKNYLINENEVVVFFETKKLVIKLYGEYNIQYVDDISMDTILNKKISDLSYVCTEKDYNLFNFYIENDIFQLLIKNENIKVELVELIHEDIEFLILILGDDEDFKIMRKRLDNLNNPFNIINLKNFDSSEDLIRYYGTFSSYTVEDITAVLNNFYAYKSFYKYKNLKSICVINNNVLLSNNFIQILNENKNVDTILHLNDMYDSYIISRKHALNILYTYDRPFHYWESQNKDLNIFKGDVLGNYCIDKYNDDEYDIDFYQCENINKIESNKIIEYFDIFKNSKNNDKSMELLKLIDIPKTMEERLYWYCIYIHLSNDKMNSENYKIILNELINNNENLKELYIKNEMNLLI